jgi:hypothetical protein
MGVGRLSGACIIPLLSDLLRDRSIQLLINSGNLSHPALPLPVFHRQDPFMGPVEVISNVGYLLKDPL